MTIGDWWMRLCATLSATNPRPSRRRHARRRRAASQVQVLESRQLLAATTLVPGIQVNTFTAGSQRTNAESTRAVAMDRDGDIFVTWVSDNQDGNGSAVVVQRYDRSVINPVTNLTGALGPEIIVNATTTGNQTNANIAVDADGDFVVTWTSTVGDGSGTGVFARRYDKGGRGISPEFQVNAFTTGDQRFSSVAMDRDGNFVVVWESQGQDGDGGGIYFQFFRADGRAVGNETRINQVATNQQRNPSVSMDDDGDFVVTWMSQAQDGSAYGVYARVYDFNPAGAGSVTAVTGEFQVNQFTTNNQQLSSVAMDALGNFVIAWQSDPNALADNSSAGVYARRYNSAGAALGGEFQVNTFTTGNQQFARVGMRFDGEFVVTWQSAAQDGNGEGIFAQRFFAGGAANGAEFQVNTNFFGGTLPPNGFDPPNGTTGNQTLPSVAMDYDGNFAFVWTSNNGVQDGSGEGVYMQVFRESVDSSNPFLTNFVFQDDALLENETVQTPVDAIGATFTELMRTTGTESITNAANWTVTRNGVDITTLPEPITFTVTFATDPLSQKRTATLTFSRLLPVGDYQVTLNRTVRDVSGRLIDQDRDGTTNELVDDTNVRNFRVRTTHPVGSESQVNTVTANTQRNFPENPQSVAMNVNGDSVVTWTSLNQDGGGYGVYAQRYNAAGAKVGAAFLVNTATSGDQLNSAVAMNDAGQFVIAWTTFTPPANPTLGPTLSTVFAKTYSAAGAVIATTTGRAGTLPSVSMTQNGDFVLTYSHLPPNPTPLTPFDNSGYGVYATRFNINAGVQVNEFLVNTFTTGTQMFSKVAMDDLGGYVVVWQSDGQEGAGGNAGIYGQRFDQFNRRSAPEFRVNNVTTGDQRFAAVAMDRDGDFIVTWTGVTTGLTTGDGSGDAIFARKFDRGLIPTAEFLVNEFTTGSQSNSRVALDSDGDFIIVWQSENQDGSGMAFMGRRYDRNLNPYGGEFQLNAESAGDQGFGGVGMDGAGNFRAAWTTPDQDGDGLGIFTQLFSEGNPPTDITLSNAVVHTNVLPFTFVGELKAIDPDDVPPGSEQFTFELFAPSSQPPVPGNALFTISGNSLLTSGAALTVGPKTIQVRVTDGGGLSFVKTFVINVPGANDVPQITLVNTVINLPELTDVSAPVRVADIVITDDGNSPYNLTLSGADADKFEILGAPGSEQLFLKAGTPLDFEVQKVLNVTVSVDDPTLGVNPDDSAALTINVTRLGQTAPVIGSFGGTVNFTEGQPPVLLDGDATVTDPDSANFNTGTLTISIIANADPILGAPDTGGDRLTIRNQGTSAGLVSVVNNQVGFGGIMIGTFVGGDGVNPLVITFNTNATRAAVQAVLRNILFSNDSMGPVVAPRTIRAVLTDGDGGASGAVTKTVTISALNTPPVIGNFVDPIVYNQGAPPVKIDLDATVFDPDSPNLAGGRLTVQVVVNAASTDRITIENQGIGPGLIGVQGTTILFGGVAVGSFSGGSGGAAFVVNFNAASSPAAAEAILRALRYQDVGALPSTLTRTLRAQLTDGDGGTSAAPTKQISIVRINQPPIVGAFNGIITYTKSGTATPNRILVDNNATVNDIDSPNFAGGSITFTLTGGAQPSDRLAIRSGVGGVTVAGNIVSVGGVPVGTFTGGTGVTPLVVSLNANCTPAAATAIVRALEFFNTSANPPGGIRTVAVLVADGDGATSPIASKQINVGLTTPLINNFGGNLAYRENDPPLIVTTTATVTDADSPNFNGGNVTFVIADNAHADDLLSVRNQGLGAGQIGVAGTNILFGGTVIGTASGGNGATPLVITLNAQATLAAVQALCRNLQFSHESENPGALTRTVSLTVTDDDGQVSNTVTKTISVAPVNDAPIVGGFDAPVTYDRSNNTPVLLDDDATLTDPDSLDFDGGRLTVQLVNNVQSTDRLSIRDQGPGANLVDVQGNQVFFNNVRIATFSGGNGATALSILFTPASTREAVEAVIRNLTFGSVATPTTSVVLLPRSVRLTLTDGDGGTSATVSKPINVVP